MAKARRAHVTAWSWPIAVPLLVVALAMPLGAASDALANPQSKERSERQGRDLGADKQVIISLTYIPIVLGNARSLGIDWVALADGETTLFADARQGVGQEDQDRIDLSFIPFVGKATKALYTAQDVAPERRVGSAWVMDRVLLVALDQVRTKINSQTQIVVLNDTWSFTLMAPPAPLETGDKLVLDPFRDLPVFRDFAETKVILPEARSILIGGLDASGAMERASKVPGLGDIPGLGRMFAGSAHRSGADKLIILIRPSIVVSDD